MKNLLIFALLFNGCQVFAADEDIVHYRTHIDRTHIQVRADGTTSRDTELAYTVLTAAAVQEGSQASFGYNPDFGSVEITAAWVEHADGSRSEVDLASAVHDRSQTTGVAAPTLTQDRMKLLVIPDVKVGDTLHYQTHSEEHRTLYPGQFSHVVEQRLDVLSDKLELIVDAPAELKLYIENEGFQAEKSTLPDGRIRYGWQISNTERKAYEEGDLSMVLTSPHVIVTTFANYGELAAAYRRGAADKTAVTPSIQALADEIAGKLTDPREVALRLSDWVSRNVRYVALYFGAGGVVPVSAEEVLKNRYGDCKGHVALLEALLKARGIASTGALIDLNGALYRLPKTTLASGFDHIISYVPSLDLWLDSTASNLPFGVLPASEAGKPALLVETGEVKSVPVNGAQKNGVALDAQLKLLDDGNLDVNARFVLHGALSTGARQYFRNLQPQGRRDFVRDVLLGDRLAGNGELTDIGEPDALDHDYSYTYHATLFSYAAVPGPFGLALPSLNSLQGPSGILQTAESYVANTRKRQSERICGNPDSTEHFTLTLPTNVTLLSMPSDLEITDGEFRYRAQYRVKGNVLDITRSLNVNRTSSICAPDTYDRYRPFFSRVMNNLRSQVLYQAATKKTPTKRPHQS